MPNRLAAESSPYLRQHADNPVDWYPWAAEAFADAVARDVPVLLSVGYSACHWCHVMAHQSFEDETVAMAMNAAFVNVKVDREERPDVDAVYMEATQAMSGHGGWPMTVLMTPGGDPFFAGTYLPRDNFLQLIANASDAWRTRRDELTSKVGAVRELLSRTARLRPADEIPSLAAIDAAVAALRQGADRQWGGFGRAPKFPSTVNLELLLAAGGHEDAELVATSLDAMAAGGIYDHVGGGFARYSVDERWLVPHFEKMLYDQAALIRVYARAASTLAAHPSAASWRQAAIETVAFVAAELRLDGGGFASALDADSPGPDGHGHEGLYHTWTPAEVAAVLDDPELTETVCTYWDITDAGNFEGRSIPNRIAHRGDLVRPDTVTDARRRLAAARAERLPPALDDKVITEWNALMIAALAEAGMLLDEPEWIDLATAAAEFLVANLRHEAHGDQAWSRVWHHAGDPPARHEALAADHAALVDAFTRLAEATGERRWIDEAVAVADVLLDRFWDVDHGGLFTRPDRGEQLVARQKELFDNATPAANSHAALALVRLAALTGEQRYANQADRILGLIAAVVTQAPTAFATALQASAIRHRGTIEVVVAGDRRDLVAAARERWIPELVLAWGERYESPLWDNRDDGQAYVCRHYACQLPVDDPAALRAQLVGNV